MKPDDIIRELIRRNTGAWFSSMSRIYGKDKAAGLIKPKSNYLQRKIQAVVDHFEELKLPIRIIILKPRQKGSTTYGSALDYTMMRRNPITCVIIGGQVAQVDECHEMLKVFQKNDRFDWGNTGEVNAKSGTWSNGSRLIRETAGDAKAGIGSTIQALHAFEVARWQEHGVGNSAEVLVNIMQAVPLLPGTLINLESTAEGQTGPFFQYWVGALDADDFLSGTKEAKSGHFVRVFAPWFCFDDSAMRLTQAEKDAIKNSLDAESWYYGEKALMEKYSVTGEDGIVRLGDVVEDYDIWEQLGWRRWSIEIQCKKDISKFERDSPHSWQTAFQKSGNMRFDSNGIDKMKKIARRFPADYGILEYAKDGERPVFRSTSKTESKCVIYERPIKGCRYIVAVDPMTGETQTGGLDPDFHSVCVMRDGYTNDKGVWRPPAEVAKIIACRWDLNVLEPEIFKLAQFYGSRSGCTIVIEMNQDKGLTELLKLRSANLYQRQIFNQIEQKTTNAYGFQTNEKTREMLIEKLAGCIRCVGEESNGIEIYDELTLDELENFVRKRNGRSEAGDGYHDDQVFGPALGLQVIGHGTIYWPPAANTWYQPPDMRQTRQQRMPGAFS